MSHLCLFDVALFTEEESDTRCWQVGELTATAYNIRSTGRAVTTLLDYSQTAILNHGTSQSGVTCKFSEGLDTECKERGQQWENVK